MAYFATPNITQPYQLLEYSNAVTDGYFGGIILLCVLTIGFVSLKDHGTKYALGASSFITMLTAVLLRLINAVNDGALYITIILTVVAMAAVWFKDRWS